MYPATASWVYWTPAQPDGRYRAWCYPAWLPGSDGDRLLDGSLPSLDEARRLCEEHAERAEKEADR